MDFADLFVRDDGADERCVCLAAATDESASLVDDTAAKPQPASRETVAPRTNTMDRCDDIACVCWYDGVKVDWINNLLKHVRPPVPDDMGCHGSKRRFIHAP